MDLPSGSFMHEFTTNVYQVKVIYQKGNKGFNWGMEIKDIRKARVRLIIDRDFGGKDAAFAAHIGRSPSYISRLFTDKVEHLRNVGDGLKLAIEKACGLESGDLDRPLTDGEWLKAGIEMSPKARPNTDIELTSISIWDEATPVDDGEVSVPYLREVELAAGSGRFVIEESSDAFLRFDKRSLRRNGVQFSNAKCVTVRGNSMTPVLRDGATVGVNTGVTSVSDITDGDLYAINHNGQLRVKQIYRLPTGIRMRSFNRDEHPDEDYSFHQMQDEQIAILGHVFWWGMYAR